MKQKLIALSQRYLRRLREHLKQGARASLHPALVLGHQTVAHGLEVLDLAKIHEQALLALILPGYSSGTKAAMNKRAGVFFNEAITPIEQTHRGARKAKGLLKQLRQTLRQRTAELAASGPQPVRHAAEQVDEALPRPTAVGFASPLLEKVQAVLATHAGEQMLSCRDLAVRVGLSACHFCTVFRKQTGVTFTEYRLGRQVNEAQRLLLEPDRRVSEIAFASGFECIPHFNRMFRRYVGCSPTEYRHRTEIKINESKIAA